MLIQCKTGSESHTTEWRSAVVLIDGKPIWESCKPLTQDWELVGNKGRHGKWCVAEYEIPSGVSVEFTAKANGKQSIIFSFVVDADPSFVVDCEGYSYSNSICGWITEI